MNIWSNMRIGYKVIVVIIISIIVCASVLCIVLLNKSSDIFLKQLEDLIGNVAKAIGKLYAE